MRTCERLWLNLGKLKYRLSVLSRPPRVSNESMIRPASQRDQTRLGQDLLLFSETLSLTSTRGSASRLRVLEGASARRLRVLQVRD